MSSIGERLNSIIVNKGLTPYQVSMRTGVSQSTLSRILKKNTKPNESNMKVLLKFFNIREEWLLTGEGKMLKTMQVVEVDPSTLVYMQVPLVGEYAQAGYLSGFADDVYVEDLPKTTWNKEGKASDYLSFEVKGDSMDDGSWKSILEGDLLLCKNIPQDLWKSKLPINKWNFVLVHKTEGILVKQISEHNEKPGLLTLKSLNSYYPPLVVNINDIAKLFYITDCRRKLRL